MGEVSVELMIIAAKISMRYMIKHGMSDHLATNITQTHPQGKACFHAFKVYKL